MNRKSESSGKNVPFRFAEKGMAKRKRREVGESLQEKGMRLSIVQDVRKMSNLLFDVQAVWK